MEQQTQQSSDETTPKDHPASQDSDGVGLGVDIVEIDRIRAILKRTPHFIERVYTEQERAYCSSTAQPEVHYATRFAAKEAVLKALGTGFACGIGPSDVEVVRRTSGRPTVALHRRAAVIAREQGIREVPLSLSYTHTDAVACAMAITDNSVKAAQERKNPMEELSRQFKEARALLDDIDKEAKETTDADV
jgi:holo-[acyl-carrier protein] synthase